MIRARLPTRASTRSFISAAALLVKVIARIEPECALRSEISQAIRRVSTRVFPEPAPATTSSGAPSWTTAARCGSFRPSSNSSRVGPRREVRGSSGVPSARSYAGRPGSGMEVLMLRPAYGGPPPEPEVRPVSVGAGNEHDREPALAVARDLERDVLAGAERDRD